MNIGVKWWESKRIIFNLFIIVCGIYGIITGMNYWEHSREFRQSDILSIFLWGILINVIYTCGIIFEIIAYYISLSKKLKWLRIFCFIVGTFILCLVTYFRAYNYYVRVELF